MTTEGDHLGAPFTRHDQYGTLGVGPLSTGEKVRLAMLAVTVLPVKLAGAMVSLLSFWLCCHLCCLLPDSMRWDTVAKLGNWHCRACLWWLGFWRVTWIQVGDHDYQQQQQGGSVGGSSAPPAVGIVSNHISWCDILLHMSHFFPSFVARGQTQRMPIIGIISQLMGCLYVERDLTAKRGSGSSSSNGSGADKGDNNCGSGGRATSSGGGATTGGGDGGDNSQAGGRVSDAVKQRMCDMAEGKLPHARPLLLFPEGTTTNGRFLLPFKTGAFLAGKPLQPVVIRYGDDRISPAWEMIPASRHMFLMLCNPLHSVTAFELPVYHPNEEERRDPRLFAHNVRKLMLDFSGLQSTPATFADKMALMARVKARHGLN